MIELALLSILLIQGVILVALLSRRRGGNEPSHEADRPSVEEGTPHVPANMSQPAEGPDSDSGNETAVKALIAGDELAIGADRANPLMHLRFSVDMPTGSSPADDPTLTRLIGSFVDVLPLIPQGLPQGYMVARFTPEIAGMVNSGQARMMVSQGEQLMKAVSTTTGKTVGTARRVSEVGVGVGAMTLGLPGIVIAAGVVAASWYHQRWVDRTLDRIAQSSAAFEIRVRDDDFGSLEAAADAAERYVNVLDFARPTPPVILQELAAASVDTNQLYRARIRRVHAFLRALDQLQADHEHRTGETVAWSKGVDRLAKDGDRFFNDAVVAVQAAMTRAKLQALTSVELALEGEPAVAQRQLVETLDACNNEVHALRRRIHALASSQPRLTVVRSNARHAAEAVGRLQAFLTQEWLTPSPSVSTRGNHLS